MNFIAQPKQRFKLQEFTNPRTGSVSWRVSGTKRDGTRVRENYPEAKAAQCRHIALTSEFMGRAPDEPAVQATRLSADQIRLAEMVFPRLSDDADIVPAIDHWLRHGKQNAVKESPRIDDAVEQYLAWLAASQLRDATKRHWRIRMGVFKNSVGNHRVSDVTPEIIDQFLATRDVSPAGKDTDRRAVSRFFSWCIDRQRRWTTANPCRAVRVEMAEKAPPSVLTVKDCKKLLRAAETHKGGMLAPYVAVCLFAGLRPFEARRITWAQVNLKDGEMRLEGNQTKTGGARVITICDTLKKWLTAHKGKPFFPANWRKEFDAVREAAKIASWPADVMRHTAVSMFYRDCESYGRTADQFGNSEKIIKDHYRGRVSSDDAKKFYALTPARRAK
jgi:integrase